MPIAAVCLPTSQRNPCELPNELFRYVDISVVDRETKSILEPVVLRGAEAPSRARKEIRGGDVLVSTVRPNLNSVCLVPDNLDGQIASTGFCVLRGDPSKVKDRFLFYYTITPDFIQYLTERTSGASYPAVSDSIVKSAMLPLPPLPEQERIVRLLGAAEELRRLRVAADRRTADFIPALFNDMFGDPSSNSGDWPIVRIEDVLDSIDFGISEPLSSGCEYQPGRIAVLRIANIKGDGHIDYSDLRYLKVSDHKRAQLLLRAGDLLFNWRNSPNWIGKTAIFDSETPCIFASFLYRLRVRDEAIDRQFLWFYLNRLRLQGFFLAKCRQAVSQANLGRDELAAVKIILPSLPLQRQFAARVAEIRALETQQAASRRRLDDLFQSMLHRAFRGEL